MNGRVNWHYPGWARAYAWLARDTLTNLELILPLLHEPLTGLFVTGALSRVTGVLTRGPHPCADGACCRFDVDDGLSLDSLVAQYGAVANESWFVHRSQLATLLTSKLDVVPSGVSIISFATTTPPVVQPLGRRLHPEDEDLVRRSNCGWTIDQFRRLLLARSVWGIVEQDRVVSRASVGYATPWTQEVLGVWTDPEFRGRKLAQRLVARLCHEILNDHLIATYTTTADNEASRCVARAVGFQQTCVSVEYVPPDRFAQI